jgi:hypothetical protein
VCAPGMAAVANFGPRLARMTEGGVGVSLVHRTQPFHSVHFFSGKTEPCMDIALAVEGSASQETKTVYVGDLIMGWIPRYQWKKQC